VAVGLIGERAPQSWDEDYIHVKRMHVICRWGNALAPMEELKKAARALWVNKRRRNMKDQIAEAERKLASIDEDAAVMFETGEAIS
jgi:hypothetical protein